MNVARRVLLRMLTARDASITRDVLSRAGIDAVPCVDTSELLRELDEGAGAVLVAEESFSGEHLARTAEWLDAQPAWSDLPVLMIARAGTDSPAVARVMTRVRNLAVLERPVRMAALVATSRSMLRARDRQYEVRDLLGNLREDDRRKTEFIATMAHELRNPLAPMATSIALLERLPAEPEVAHHHEVIARQVRHMARLVDDLLEVSRITRGRVVLRRGPVDVAKVVGDAIEISRPLLDAGEHRLAVEMCATPLWVDADPTRLTQVLSNLLNNAAKYTPKRGKLAVRTREEGPDAVIEVSDDGAGIAPDMLGRVFDMFMQAPGAARQAQGGLGVGLTLAKRLMDLHGGSVVARSDGLGKGATFSVRLPRIAPKAADRAGADPSIALAAPLAAEGRRVLVVDDNRDAADSLAALLGMVGVAAATAYDGPGAIARVAAEPFDLVVLDIGMPGMDGCEVARRLRAGEAAERPRTRLVALTGWGQEADHARIVDAGFDRHLLKPVDIEALLGVLAS